MGSGAACPLTEMLTTQRAADLLNVSGISIKLLERGHIPFEKVNRRSVKAQDLFAYQSKRKQIRAEALQN